MKFGWWVIGTLLTISTMALAESQDVKNFLTNWGTSLSKLEDSVFSASVQNRKSAFLKAVIEHFKDTHAGELKLLSQQPEIHQKLREAWQALHPDAVKESLSLTDLSELLANPKFVAKPLLSEEESLKLSTLLLVNLSAAGNKSDDFLTSAQQLLKSALNDPIPTSLDQALAQLEKKMEESLRNVEDSQQALAPLFEQSYSSQKKAAPPSLRFSLPPDSAQALEDLSKLAGSFTPNLDFPLRPLPPPRGNSGSTRGGIQNFRRAVPSFGQTVPENVSSETSLACVAAAREKALNIPLALPGGRCGSTAVSKDPIAEQSSLQKNGMCPLVLATALHCIQRLPSLEGFGIGVSIGGSSVRALVQQTVNPDQLVNQFAGKAVDRGNPDLTLLKVAVPCEVARKTSLVRVPTPAEISKHFTTALPLALYQNPQINASSSASNRAVLAAEGIPSGNFLQFNSHSSANRNGAGNANFIQPGDSGSPAVTCKFNEEGKPELLFAGAMSHIDVRGDRYEGMVGGVASNHSLRNLSELFYNGLPNQVSFNSSSSSLMVPGH